MRLIITPGDPQGIGPEVTAKALAHDSHDNIVVIGEIEACAAALERYGVVYRTTDSLPHLSARGVDLLAPPDGPEPVEVRAIREAVAACLAGQADAMVTGPIHKARLAARGFMWAGHTDFLAHLCRSHDPVMAFVGGQLRVALVTVHMSLRAVPDAITPERVAHTITTAHAALVRDLGLSAPRIAVCGLNPHAGDDGLLGHEETDIIAPIVNDLRNDGLDLHGPISAEAAFRAAMAGAYDLVVAMYHDQGLAPLKAVDFGRSVNWTLGLPILRTSVDHGTADDIAGRGLADESSMIAAIAWARTLAEHRSRR